MRRSCATTTPVDEHGKRVNTFKHGYAVLDEFQVVAGRNFEAFMEAARSNGLGLILANQAAGKTRARASGGRRRKRRPSASTARCGTGRTSRISLSWAARRWRAPARTRDGEPRFREVPRLSENLLRR